MNRSSNRSSGGWGANLIVRRLPGLTGDLRWNEPRVIARAILGVLLLANLVMAALVFHPFGGAPEDLERELSRLRLENQRRKSEVERLKSIVAKVEKGKTEGDRFLRTHFLPRHAAYSTLVSELSETAKETGITPKSHVFEYQPIEGSETLSMLTINGNYEGNYADLIQFLNAIDQSDRLLIIDGLGASPLQTPGMLSVNLQLNTFVQEGVPVEAAAAKVVEAEAKPATVIPRVESNGAPAPGGKESVTPEQTPQVPRTAPDRTSSPAPRPPATPANRARGGRTR